MDTTTITFIAFSASIIFLVIFSIGATIQRILEEKRDAKIRRR